MKFLLFCLLLLTACAGVQQRIPEIPDVYVGTSALNLRFHPATSASIFMGSQADVLLEAENVGAHNIEDGRYVWIFEKQYFGALDGFALSGSFSLEGRSTYAPVGGFSQFALRLRSKDFPPQVETYTTPVIFQTCFPYQTNATTEICIDTDLRGVRGKKVCLTKPVTFSNGQGGPVAVTKIEPSMVPEGDEVSVAVAVYLKNVGQGQVIAKKMIGSACGQAVSNSFAREGFNVLDVRVELGGRTLRCLPRTIQLRPNEETRLFCRSDEKFGPAQGTFTTLVKVSMDYAYMQTASHSFFIKRLQ